MALLAALEADLRAISAEARRRYPAVKDGAEQAILKLRSLSGPSAIVDNEDILRIFLIACDVKVVKLSVIGLSSLQKLISHDAVAPSALNEILSTLKEHGEMADETIQLKTLQTILIIFQSALLPTTEENMSRALHICLRLLENSRSSDNVISTAAATIRQAIALIFDLVIRAESLTIGKNNYGGYVSRSNSITSDVNRGKSHARSLEYEVISECLICLKEIKTESGKLGLLVLEDLTALSTGGSATWLRVHTLSRTFALEILEFILSNYVVIFKTLSPYEQILRCRVCSFFMTSLRTNLELEEEAGEPYFRRLILRCVAHVIRNYCSSLFTEVEVFLSMLLKVTFLEQPLWHRILVLEILRGFCVEARTLKTLFKNFDMHPKNSNVVEGIVKALARVVADVQEASDDSLAVVAGMFNSKAKGIEWTLENDASNAAVLVASEAHAITLAIEGLLGVVFTVATLTDEAVDSGELESPRCEFNPDAEFTGELAVLCRALVDSLWMTILDSLSLILYRSQGEAIVIEILKGYQAFIQVCGALHAVEPLNSFLASLCKFTINFPVESDRRSLLQNSGSRRNEFSTEFQECVVLTPKNVQALRTLFNVAHRLHNVLGTSWVLVLETLANLDRTIRSPHTTTTLEISSAVSILTRQSSGRNSDFSILSSLNSQLFESSGLMHLSAVMSLLTALHQLSYQCMSGASSGFGAANQKLGNINFAVERMISILVNNTHRVEPLWEHVVGHFIELADNSNYHLRNLALDALDQSICAVLESQQFLDISTSKIHRESYNVGHLDNKLRSIECSIMSPLAVLYLASVNNDVRAGTLKLLLGVIERHGENLHYSWPNVLELLRSAADAVEKDLVILGFKCLRTIINDGLNFMTPDCIPLCVDVAGAYCAQKSELNISLTAVGLLWTMTDFVAKRVSSRYPAEKESGVIEANLANQIVNSDCSEEIVSNAKIVLVDESKELLFTVFFLLQQFGADERPEVRNTAVRTLFQTLGSHGHTLTEEMWESCLNNYVVPSLNRASHMAATSSTDEWRGKELGTRGGKAVHMLIHHSRNTAQKQWEETLVLVLGGISRLFRSFIPLLCRLKCFSSGWECLLLLMKSSMLDGNKEIAVATISCLQSSFHCSNEKGTLPITCICSIIDVYETAIKMPLSNNKNSRDKVKQEVLRGLGELYVQSQLVFSVPMFTQLLSIIDVAIGEQILQNENFEAEFEHLPPVLRTVLDILPTLRPGRHLSSMWTKLLRRLLLYLPMPVFDNDQTRFVDLGDKAENPQDKNTEASLFAPSYVLSNLFGAKLVPVLVDFLLQAPEAERHVTCPEIIRCLGRCMITRRDNPGGPLWRAAAESINRVVLGVIGSQPENFEPDSNLFKAAKLGVWKEVAEVYEIFLIGHCGRPIPSNSISSEILEADSAFEISIVSVLSDKILKEANDAPPHILQRIISTIDTCASRMSSLPIHSVELVPLHCCRFSLTCLQKLFSLCRAKLEVSKIAIEITVARCHCIIERFLTDEKSLEGKTFPSSRLEEIIYVLEELSLLQLHEETALALSLPSSLRNISSDPNNRRSHLLKLFPSLCDLVMAREHKVRELVQVLLRFIVGELALEKLCFST